eukprot:6561730-Alexandrium_andersonii.AAC.1
MRGRRTGAHAQTPGGARAKVERETGYNTTQLATSRSKSQPDAPREGDACPSSRPGRRRAKRAVAAKGPEETSRS